MKTFQLSIRAKVLNLISLDYVFFCCTNFTLINDKFIWWGSAEYAHDPCNLYIRRNVGLRIKNSNASMHMARAAATSIQQREY
jgi:hypothetical protein